MIDLDNVPKWKLRLAKYLILQEQNSEDSN